MEEKILTGKFLTIAEVSKILKLSRGTISQMVINHKLKAYRVGKKYIVSIDAIREMLEKNEV